MKRMLMVALLVGSLLAARESRAQAGLLFPIAECMTVADQTIEVRFGYLSNASTVLTRPTTPDDNIFVGGSISPHVGQPAVFVPGRHRDVFRASFDLVESPTYAWVLNGQVLIVRADTPLCRDHEQRRIIGLLECVQPPNGNTPALARFGYVNPGAPVTLPQRSSRNYFANANGLFSVASQRGQPTTFASGVQRAAFTVTFDPATEPLLIWEIDGESVPASLDLPNVPLCTPLANLAFANGLESNV